MLRLLLRLLCQRFKRREIVDGVFIVAVEYIALVACAALVFAQRGEAGLRRQNQRALHRSGHAFFIQKRHQRFAHAQFADGCGHIDVGVAAEGIGGGLHRFLVARGKGAQGVLDAVAQLPQYGVGQIKRVLGNKVHAHAFGANQAHHLLYLLQQRRGGVVEQQMGFVEKHHKFGFVRIAHFRQRLKQLRQHPQQKGAVHARAAHELF